MDAIMLFIIQVVFEIVLLTLFVRLCGRAKDIRDVLLVAHGLEKRKVYDKGVYTREMRFVRKSDPQ